MRLTHLHAHTTFSFLDGYGTPSQITERLVELGHTACAITDHGGVFGHVPCGQAYQKAGVKPIYGCEFYICDDISVREPIQPSLGYKCLPHITVLARTQEGYGNLLKLIRLSSEVGFYGKPRIDHHHLFNHQSGLVVLSGCPGGYPTRKLLALGYQHLLEHLQWCRERIEHYYVELTPQPGWDVSYQAISALCQAAGQLGLPVVATADCHFPKPSDHRAQDALLAVGLRTTVDDPGRELKLPAYQYYCTAEELLQRLQEVWQGCSPQAAAQAVENSAIIGDICQVELTKAKSVAFPDVPAGKDSPTHLWEEVARGYHSRLQAGLIPSGQELVYIERAQHEFKVLREKGFCDYILSIADVIRHMKQRDALIMTRGSAGGSLLLFLLGASETDPLIHGLSFERFYDSTRPDPPDVDIDFEQARRDEATEYLYEKYGRANCSQIAALSRLAPRGAIQDACSALGIPRARFSALSEVINDKDYDMARQLESLVDPKAKSVIDSNPGLRELIVGMVGQYRHSSIHAAGVLISSEPLESKIGVIVSDGRTIAAVDKYGAASLGFLKIDMLAVQALDVISRAAKAAVGSVDWLYRLPLDDPKVLATADQGLLAGVFQLDGATAKQALSSIGAHSFRDLVAASVLCRPGASDSIPLYRKHKYNAGSFDGFLSSIHPGVADIVRDTYGVLMYQEQVMRIAREIAGMEWQHVHKLRKGVADKLGLDPQKGDAWRAEWYQRFVVGAMHHSQMSQAEAEEWWHKVQVHGGYSFNKSHAVTYGVIGYWMLYLKTYYPAQFYEAYLQLENDDIVKKRLILEFKRGGGTVKVLDPHVSRESFFAPDSRTLVGGYSDLKFIGPAIAKKALEKAPFTDLHSCLAALPKRTRELLEAAGITNGHVDPQALIKVAPWMPVSALAEEDASLKAKYMVRSVGDMPDVESEGSLTMCGYVTSTSFDKDRLVFTVEDERAMAMVRVPSKKVKGQVGQIVRELKPGDFIAVEGWWTGDTMFVNQYAMLRKCTLV